MAEREEDFQFGDDFAAAREEPRGFAPEQMVACARCSRTNGPTRMSCIYCGEPLPVTEQSAALRRPVLRPLEGWERGVNVVLSHGREERWRGSEVSGEATEEAASLLKIEAGRLREMFESRLALPLARAASAEEAALIEGRLAALGIGVETIPDELLAAESEPPARIRTLEIGDEQLKGRAAGGEALAFAWADVLLIAAGRIFTKRVEVEERGALAKRTSEMVEAREYVSDEAALEIYARGEARGWRINSDGFDYSCLGDAKGLLARENFSTLAGALRGRAPAAEYDDGYNRVRHLLAAAWPVAERTESGGLRRTRPGKFNTESVTVLTNDAQFTRYARLRYQLELRRREPSATE